MLFRKILRRVNSLFVLPLLLVLAFMIAGTSTAQARLIVCRGDPFVWLSNHTKIHLVTDVTINVNKRVKDKQIVNSIDYVIHVEPGLSVTKIQLNNGWKGKKEHVTVIADGNPGEITVDATVTTTQDPVPVKLRVTATKRNASSKQIVKDTSGKTIQVVIDQP